MSSRFRLSEFREVHPLASAVHRQLGIPVSELPDTLADVRRGGADSGFPGFTYYADTVSFAKRHRAAILDSLAELADDLGEGRGISGAVKLAHGFRLIKDFGIPEAAVYSALMGGRIPSGIDPRDVDQVRNSLAWYALEEVASRAESLTP